MASWGDVNATLNRLVREGVISGFRTNRGDKSSTGLHVTVTPGADARPEDLKARIMSVLTPLDDEVTVTVGAELPTVA